MENAITFWDLFPSREEYPDNIAERGVPQGTFYKYISSSFLDGLVNYVDIFAAYVIQPPYGALSEYKADIEKSLSNVNTTLSDFGLIDVILLAETKSSFWVFWYDPDVSDCCIARCSKEWALHLQIDKDEFRRLFLLALLKDDTYMRLPKLPQSWISWD